MPGKKGNRPWVNMYCQEMRMRWVKGEKRKEMVEVEKKCNGMNYVTEKHKRNTPDKLELKKFCSTCGKHTPHKEGK